MSDDATLLSQCLEWTKQLMSQNEEVFVNIRMGDFRFSFDNKKNIQIKKTKSPSQQRRNFDRQAEFKKRLEKKENNLEASEEKVTTESEKKDFNDEKFHEPKIEVETVATQTDTATLEKETQTEYDQNEPAPDNTEINEKGEIVPKPNETIIELKFSHDLKNWDEVKMHITENLRLKILGKPWLANNGRHFKTIAFKTLRRDFEIWKQENLNWENIARPVTLSRIYK